MRAAWRAAESTGRLGKESAEREPNYARLPGQADRHMKAQVESLGTEGASPLVICLRHTLHRGRIDSKEVYCNRVSFLAARLAPRFL